VKRFFVEGGRLRTVFRILFFLVCFQIAQIAAMPLRPDRTAAPVTLFVFAILYALVRGGGVTGASYVCRRWVDRRPWRDIGLDLRPRRLLEAALGLVLGALGILAVFGVELGAGWARVLAYDPSPALLGATLVACFGGALAEEVALRGYVYQNVAERGPAWRAALITGVIFALLHAHVPGFGIGAFAGFVVFTALLVLTRLFTGSLWLAVGFHTSWNWTQDPVLGLSNVGEADFGHALVHVEQHGPPLVVGRAPIIEGGLLAIAVLSALALAATLFARARG
jgi:membrane protease YdiL (CAAX protease family)